MSQATDNEQPGYPQGWVDSWPTYDHSHLENPRHWHRRSWHVTLQKTEEPFCWIVFLDGVDSGRRIGNCFPRSEAPNELEHLAHGSVEGRWGAIIDWIIDRYVEEHGGWQAFGVWLTREQKYAHQWTELAVRAEGRDAESSPRSAMPAP